MSIRQACSFRSPPSSLSGLSPRAGGISVCEAVLPPGIPVLAGFWSHSPQLPSTSSLEAQCGHALQIPRETHARRHSPAALFSPRRRNWRKPKTDLMMPNTGSTVCFLSAYAARPVFVLSRCAMRSAGVAEADSGAGSVKRSRHLAWCSSRATAMSGSIPASSQATTFLPL